MKPPASGNHGAERLRCVCWLHISDIHLTLREVWSQGVVLRAMCKQIESQRADGHATS